MAWYEIFYRIFNLKDRTREHNNFGQSISGSTKIESTCKSESKVPIKEHGRGGFGVGDIDSYMNRPGVRRTYEKVRNSDWWKKINQGK